MTSSVLDGIVSEEITWSMLVFWERMHFRLVPKKTLPPCQVCCLFVLLSMILGLNRTYSLYNHFINHCHDWSHNTRTFLVKQTFELVEAVFIFWLWFKTSVIE